MKMHVMIAEDERIAREELTYLLQQENDVILCESANNGEELLKLYQSIHPDVIFLDIHMPGINGIEVAQLLRKGLREPKPLIVFTTAYDNYGVQAFDIQATDYLLKPYDKARFQVAMERVRTELSVKESSAPQFDKLVISVEEKMRILDPKQIGYAVREGKILKIYKLDNEVIETKMNLKELEEKLRGYSFYRPHRSYLVNLDAVTEITPWFNGAYNLVINDSEKSQIPVSRTAWKGFMEALHQT
ncbi:LytTR family DNA-binding domain-containing protein [Aquibacillus koreensis]|uniref:LytTR family DNA-binding domain-containing protein n=1 Tax=Aquibacillus koreensis TaxID=279446 RepID=A0A9X4AIG5_9BACI|nr:LytTR family DNA-binding domain-containing protein [Aquibacillus koreensis]MCT2537836.1 LytTR family DNA-binding domain-containing protein [Aquibacillus koreensis]MDC3421132.1 LytTR family DNA-binding domain-containing protein [Aquibacillus koreensis]